MKKRIVSLLLALVMAVSLLPVSAFAVDVDTPQDDAPVAETQDVPAAEQQNDENTTPDTPATTEESTQSDAEPATGESQPEEPVVQDAEPAAEPKVYVTSNVWDKTVEVVTVPESIKGGKTGAFSYVAKALRISPVEKVKVGDVTCNLIAVALNGVRYEKVSSAIKIPAGTFKGVNMRVTVGVNLALIKLDAKGELTDNFSVEFIYDNVPPNTEEPLFTPVVDSNNATYGSVTTTSFVANNENSSTWTVTTTPKNEWYKLGYVADEAGNQFASTDGKTARITVAAADQKFTAYFTSAIAPMYDETNADSVTVNVTLSNDGIPLIGKDGTILANLDVTVPYFDLASYGLEAFYRYGTEFGWGDYNDDNIIERPTALHAYIYLLERYYMGIPESDCGTGKSYLLDYNKATDVLYMDGTKAYNSDRTYALTPTGSATSLYMKTFWGHDENLMYFRNHEYPLMGKGWGSTCDYILLSDGDRLDVAMFTNWDFYKDGGFNQFSQDAYTVMAGDTVTTSTFKAGTSAAQNGESPALEPISGLNVAVYDANWNKVVDVTGDGTYSYTFTKAGTYYIMGVDANAKTNNAHYAPAIAKVTVEGEIDGDGSLVLRNADDMLRFQNYVNNGHPDAKAVLAADINLTGIQWSGIKGFTGSFDGAGHTLTVALTDTGLFNDLAGTVKNLTVKGTVTGARAVGGIASTAKGGTVVIENCVNKANITNTEEILASGSACTGGIVGKLVYSTANISTAIINCRNYGTITANAGYTGGILGVDDTETKTNIIGCENHGPVTGSYTGGIVGSVQHWMTISKCLNTGTVKGRTVGGILGHTTYYTGIVEQCVNTGSVSGQTAGGIVGYNHANIDSCYNTGSVSGNKAGGIAGINNLIQIRNTWSYTVDKVVNSYTTGTVTGTGENPVIGAAVGVLHEGGDPSQKNTYRDFQVYALEGTCAQLVGQKSENAKDATAFKTAAELKSDAMLTTLGDAFKKDAGNVNNGYPVLVWQVSEACTDHTPGAAVRENEVPATCTKDGSHDEVIYCTICKTEISRKTITDKATGHKAQAAVKENVKDATCTAAGSHDEVVYCSVCQTEISRTTVTDKALGHDWDSATGKCKRCETACDHKWTNGKCDTCGYTCQHVGGDAVKEKEVPATCTKDGSHDEVVYCTICKSEVSRTNVVDKATGHKWDDGVVTTQPTTGKEGVKTFICTVCKETKTETIDKLGEDQKDQSAANEAINLINGIGTVTKNSKDKINAARKAYDGLTEDQKKLVPDSVLKTLTDAEAAYAKMTKPGTKPGKPSTSTDTKKDDGKTVKSGQTGDAGIVLYAAMGLLSLTGGALVLGKKKKQD